jgi:hypothetical protein
MPYPYLQIKDLPREHINTLRIWKADGRLSEYISVDDYQIRYLDDNEIDISMPIGLLTKIFVSIKGLDIDTAAAFFFPKSEEAAEVISEVIGSELDDIDDNIEDGDDDIDGDGNDDDEDDLHEEESQSTPAMDDESEEK